MKSALGRLEPAREREKERYQAVEGGRGDCVCIEDVELEIRDISIIEQC